MGVVKKRGAIGKLGPLSGRVVQITHNNINRKFAIHEDLLCATSKLFKRRLQKHRKSIGGECSICSEELNATKADLTFCRSECGQNFHQHCIEEWKSSQADENLTCPMCRCQWKAEPKEPLNLSSQENIEPEALQLYVEWLYTGVLQVGPEFPPETDEFNVFLLKAWRLAIILEDRQFASSIIALLMTHFENEVNIGFREASIEYAYCPETPRVVETFVYTCTVMMMPAKQIYNKVEQSSNILQIVDKEILKQRSKWFRRFTEGDFELVHESE